MYQKTRYSALLSAVLVLLFLVACGSGGGGGGGGGGNSDAEMPQQDGESQNNSTPTVDPCSEEIIIEPAGATVEKPSIVHYAFHTYRASDGQPVNVEPDKFVLREDGEPLAVGESFYDIEHVADIDRQLLKTLIVMDVSASINSGDLEAMRASVEKLIVDADSGQSQLLPGQAISLYTFDDTLRRVIPNYETLEENPEPLFIRNIEGLTTALKRIEIGGLSTDLFGSVLSVLDQMHDVWTPQEVQASVALIITDGRDTADRATLEQVVRARGSKTVYAIAIGDGADVDALEEITDGRVFAVDDYASIGGALAQFHAALARFDQGLTVVHYATPSRSGTHELEVAIECDGQTKARASTNFDADGFSDVDPRLVIRGEDGANPGETLELNGRLLYSSEVGDFSWSLTGSEQVSLIPDEADPSVARLASDAELEQVELVVRLEEARTGLVAEKVIRVGSLFVEERRPRFYPALFRKGEEEGRVPLAKHHLYSPDYRYEDSLDDDGRIILGLGDERTAIVSGDPWIHDAHVRITRPGRTGPLDLEFSIADEEIVAVEPVAGPSSTVILRRRNFGDTTLTVTDRNSGASRRIPVHVTTMLDSALAAVTWEPDIFLSHRSAYTSPIADTSSPESLAHPNPWFEGATKINNYCTASSDEVWCWRHEPTYSTTGYSGILDIAGYASSLLILYDEGRSIAKRGRQDSFRTLTLPRPAKKLWFGYVRDNYTNVVAEGDDGFWKYVFEGDSLEREQQQLWGKWNAPCDPSQKYANCSDDGSPAPFEDPVSMAYFDFRLEDIAQTPHITACGIERDGSIKCAWTEKCSDVSSGCGDEPGEGWQTSGAADIFEVPADIENPVSIEATRLSGYYAEHPEASGYFCVYAGSGIHCWGRREYGLDRTASYHLPYHENPVVYGILERRSDLHVELDATNCEDRAVRHPILDDVAAGAPVERDRYFRRTNFRYLGPLEADEPLELTLPLRTDTNRLRLYVWEGDRPTKQVTEELEFNVERSTSPGARAGTQRLRICN